MENNSGGFLVGRKNGKIYIHNDGSMGGFIVGRRHSEGGVQGYNNGSGTPIEVEGGEIQVSAAAVQDNTTHDFEGKKMTSREILSYLNEQGGGVRFDSGGKVENEYKKSASVIDKGAGNPIEYQGGEVILTRGAVSSPSKYSFNGRQMTTREIASEINVKAGGVSFMSGGDTKESDCGCGNKMNSGGIAEMDDKNLLLKMEIEDRVNGTLYQKFKSGELSYVELLKGISLNRMAVLNIS